jgi:hypothetical protein
MSKSEAEAALQAFAACGADRGVIYLSTPITTGRREFAVMERLGVDQATLRAEHKDVWLDEVVAPNERDAVLHADLVTETFALGQLVVNPARISLPEWTQDHYDDLWAELLERFPCCLVPAPGWAYSRGARVEVQTAIDRGLLIRDVGGDQLTAEELAAEAGRVDDELAARGWGRLLPTALPAVVARAGDATQLVEPPPEAHARHIFGWLVRERNYQLAKFGTGRDDANTVESGLSEDGWWTRQLAMYYHRARLLQLDNVRGRQALAKYVATACGLLESAARVHGPLPEPGVPSGTVVGEQPSP